MIHYWGICSNPITPVHTNVVQLMPHVYEHEIYKYSFQIKAKVNINIFTPINIVYCVYPGAYKKY